MFGTEKRNRIGLQVIVVMVVVLASYCYSHAQVEKPVSDSAKLDELYQTFVDEFRGTQAQEDRLQLVEKSSKQINDFLKDKLVKPDISKLLPNLVPIRLLNIDESLVSIIDDHPDDQVKALAVLCFAKHCGNNGRDETCKTSLAFLKKRYGELKYEGDVTFGEAAEEAFYFLTNLTVGKKAPEVAGSDEDGTVFRLADYEGKVVMLRFWGDWCPACRAMFDYERELVKKYKNRPFALVGVNSDSLKQLKSAQQRANLTWRTIWDGGSTRGPISTVYRVNQWPTIVVIDAEGTIRFRSDGLTKPQLEEVLTRYIDKASNSDASELASQ